MIHTALKKLNIRKGIWVSFIATLAVTALCFTFLAWAPPNAKDLRQSDVRVLPKPVFSRGEKLEYRVHYGFFNAGEATIKVHDNYYELGERPCYKMEVLGRSVGAFDRIIRIRDTWGTFMDTGAYKPRMAYRYVEENKYRLKEVVTFDYVKRIAKVDVKDRRDTAYRIPDPVHDIVSGYYFLRQIDYSKVKPGEVLNIDAFFENSNYQFRLRLIGRETIKTKFGKVKCIVLSPIMPKNGLFDGENSIRLWMSDDAIRIPVKVRAELFVGAVELDITSYQGTKVGLGSS